MSEPHKDPLPSINFEKTLAGSGDTDVPISEADRKLLEAIPQVADFDARFETIGLLGQGGMGEVSLSRDRSLGRRVAVKRIRPELVGNAGALLRFWNEAKGVAAINHAHVVQIHEFFRSPQGCFLVMEYVDGESLADRIREDGHLSVEEVREIGRSLCGALAAAHQEGLIHRDIKPANVLLSKQGVAKLVDFGLVRMTAGDASLTRAGAVLGTFEFMPPEQLEDPTKVDARSDLWSLGATLYKAATGGNVRVIRPHKIPEALRDVLLKSLEDDPADRFQTAEEFAAALAGAMVSAPVSITSPPPMVSPPRVIAEPVVVESPAPEPKPEAVPLIAPFDAATALAAQETWARSLGLESHIQRNSIGMEMVLIPPGEYLMGSEENADERPIHRVRISKPFWLGKTTVTQAQWSAVMGTEPWKGNVYIPDGSDFPATCVSWDDAQEFLRKLNAKERSTNYRLPTEAEWEYACRSGTTTKWSVGDVEADLEDHAWYDRNTRYERKANACSVGQKLPNGFGLHDMHGTIWEWCSDWYDKNEYRRYASEMAVDPSGANSGWDRVRRGGSWRDSSELCRSSCRSKHGPRGLNYRLLGFRVARILSGE